jgi:hypothetical protein
LSSFESYSHYSMLGLHSELTFWELDRLFEIVDIV